MGYRSDVVYRIVFSNKDTMELFIAEAKSKPELAIAFLGEDGNTADNDEYLKEVKCDRPDTWELRFSCSHWKWYTEYDMVKAHEGIVELARDYSERQVEDRNDDGDMIMRYVNDVQYAFARIGEEMEDVDIFGSDDYYELLEISRSIEII